MSNPLVTPQELAEAMHPDSDYALSGADGIARVAAWRTVTADREAFAAWCDEQKQWAQDMVQNCVSGGDGVAAREYDGQVIAYEAMAARLRGAP